MRHGDFTAQELSIACFRFQVIDFGDSIPIQDALMRSTGNVGNVERNQCVLLHLAAGILWNESGRPKRAPDRGMVFTLVQEIRRLELKNALLAAGSLRDETSLEEMIVKSNAHDVCNPSRDRDFRTLGFFLLSVLTDRNIGCLRIFDVGRGTNGYDVSVHLPPNVSGDNGSAYIDLVARRHHMRWGKLVDDTRPKGLVGWETASSSVVHSPVLSWSEFIHHPTETDLIAPVPCIYCMRKVKIPVEVPLLQAESKCGGKRRNYIETEENARRVNSADIVVEPASLSWIPAPNSPLIDTPEQRRPPPYIAHPLSGNRESSIRQHRDAIAKRWSRTGEAAFPSVSFNWSDNLPPTLTSCAQKYLDSVDVECNVGNLWAVADLGDNLNRLSGDVRISARHIQGIVLSKRKYLVDGLEATSHVDPVLAEQVKVSTRDVFLLRIEV